MKTLEPLRQAIRETMLEAVQGVITDHKVWDHVDEVLENSFADTKCILVFDEGKAQVRLWFGESEAMFEGEPELSIVDDDSVQAQIDGIANLVDRLQAEKRRLEKAQ